MVAIASLAEGVACASCVAAVVGLVVARSPASLGAWGMDVHRVITRRAIERLPPNLRPFFAAQIGLHRRARRRSGSLAHRRTARRPRRRGSESLPRHRRARRAGAVRERAARLGRVRREVRRRPREPRRAPAVAHARRSTRAWSRRSRTSARAPRRTPPTTRAISSAVLSHYVEDAHVPFHAIGNYDGQLTNQRGIHSRFETDARAPQPADADARARDDHADSEHPRLHLRDADRQPGARREPSSRPIATPPRGREVYDDAYFGAFFAGARAGLEQRMSEAASAVASAIVERVGPGRQARRCPSAARALRRGSVAERPRPHGRLPRAGRRRSPRALLRARGPRAARPTIRRRRRTGPRKRSPRSTGARSREGEEARRNAGSTPPRPRRGRVRRWMTSQACGSRGRAAAALAPAARVGRRAGLSGRRSARRGRAR